VIDAGGRYRRPVVVACTVALAAMAGVAGVLRLRAAGRTKAPAGMAAAASDDDLAAISASHEQSPPSPGDEHERAVALGKRLDDRLVAETRDAAWAPAFEQALRKATESALTEPGAESITNSECRSTICRLEVRHPDGAHGDSFQTRFRMAMPDVVYRVSQAQNDDGSYSSVFHIIKKGEPIPSG
jgi:hypothetical protein